MCKPKGKAVPWWNLAVTTPFPREVEQKQRPSFNLFHFSILAHTQAQIMVSFSSFPFSFIFMTFIISKPTKKNQYHKPIHSKPTKTNKKKNQALNQSIWLQGDKRWRPSPHKDDMNPTFVEKYKSQRRGLRFWFSGLVAKSLGRACNGALLRSALEN